MEWIKNIIEIYALLFILVIHASLIFCKKDDCMFDSSGVYMVLPRGVIYIIEKMINLIPLSLSTIQMIAQ
jgi:hypothetical protein